jgi:CubicO group peptidase (beta-lactamase class C family)
MAADPSHALASFLDGWVESGAVTAAFALVATRDRTVWSGGAAASGASPARSPGRPTASSLFDAASLTKPWMATLALALDQEDALALGATLGEVWPGCSASLADTVLEDLLRHRAGFAPWTPLYHRCRRAEQVERLLASGALLERVSSPAAPVAVRYGDLDFVTWGIVAERRLGTDLADLLRRFVLEPLGARGVAVAPGAGRGVLPCTCDTDREVELAAQQGLRIARRGPPALGEPQDGNARFLGGLGAHAGLFVSAEDVLKLGREWLMALDGRGRLLRRESVRRALAGSGEYALGWARRRVKGTAGPALSRASFGHVGFTGPSLWIDPDAGAVHVLLAHRRDAASALNPARRRFHALATAAVESGGRRAGAKLAPPPRRRARPRAAARPQR